MKDENNKLCFNDNVFDDFKPSPIIEKAKMKYKLNSRLGNIAPDTFGVDNCFTSRFFNYEMYMDFQAIEKDFLKNCYDNILTSKIQLIDDGHDKKNYSPENAVLNRIIYYIYSGAKSGDEYCLSLIKYMYRVYHKKEYNQLKRFHIINKKEIFSMAQSDDEHKTILNIARILGMCHFLGIEIDSSCTPLYVLLETYYEHEISEYEQEEPKDIDQLVETYAHNTEQILDWLDELGKPGFIKYYQSLEKYWSVIESSFNQLGFPSDFIECPTTSDTLVNDCANILNILKNTKSVKNISIDTVFHYLPALWFTRSISEIWKEFQDEFSIFFGEEAKYKPRESLLFDPKKVQPEKQSENKTSIPVNQVPKFVAPVKSEVITSEEYLEEIASLRAKLHEKEKETKWLKELYHDAKSGHEKYESLQKEYENQRKELIALREFAYRSSKEFEDLPQMTIAEMQKAIETKEIVIIGGHVNWINKIQKTFRNWVIIPANASRTIDTNILTGKERVYFFTDYIDHTTYGKYVAICREKQIPFGYLHGVNIETMTQQIYEDMIEK